MNSLVWMLIVSGVLVYVGGVVIFGRLAALVSTSAGRRDPGPIQWLFGVVLFALF
jgi:hypothetical protein